MTFILLIIAHLMTECNVSNSYHKLNDNITCHQCKQKSHAKPLVDKISNKIHFQHLHKPETESENCLDLGD